MKSRAPVNHLRLETEDSLPDESEMEQWCAELEARGRKRSVVSERRGEIVHWLCNCDAEPSHRHVGASGGRHWADREFVATVNGVQHEVHFTRCRNSRDGMTYADLIGRVTGFKVVARDSMDNPPWMRWIRWIARRETIPVVYASPGLGPLVLKRDLLRACLPRRGCSVCVAKVKMCAWIFRGANTSDSDQCFCRKECMDPWLRNMNAQLQALAALAAEAALREQALAAEAVRQQLADITSLERIAHLRWLLWRLATSNNDPEVLTSLREEFARLQNSQG
jgi:hypothetical protein